MTDPKEKPSADEPLEPKGSGWDKADTDVDDYPPHDFDKEDLLEGEVIKTKVVPLMRRAELVDVRMAVIAKPDGEMVLLWEAANLGNFFDNIVPGMEIHVRARGVQHLTGKRTMKLFDAYYR